MYIKDGVAYAGEAAAPVRVWGVRPLPGHRLWVRFSTGEAKIIDFTPYLSAPAFLPLCDEDIFRQVYIDYGMTVWQNGDIDIAPETLYRDGVAAVESA